MSLKCNGATDVLRKIAYELCEYAFQPPVLDTHLQPNPFTSLAATQQVDAGPDVVAFTFDRVVYDCVRAPSKVYFDIEELIHQAYINAHVEDMIKMYRARSCPIYILSNNTHLGVSDIRRALRHWNVTVDDVLIGDKINALKAKNVTVFFEGSLSTVEKVHKVLPALTIVHYIRPSTTSISVFTYNVSWESTVPKQTGFGELGKACRENLMACRGNIVRVIRAADADLVALQEVPASMMKLLEDEFSDLYKIDMLNDRVKHGVEGQMTLWKKERNLHVEKVVHDTFEFRNRPFTVLTFDEFVFVNLHAGHNYSKKNFTRALQDHVGAKDTVILAGDFNRSMNYLRLRNVMLNNGAMHHISTCCSIRKRPVYTKHIDHIMSNRPFSTTSQGMYAGFPASDHRPVMASVKLG